QALIPNGDDDELYPGQLTKKKTKRRRSECGGTDHEGYGHVQYYPVSSGCRIFTGILSHYFTWNICLLQRGKSYACIGKPSSRRYGICSCYFRIRPGIGRTVQ